MESEALGQQHSAWRSARKMDSLESVTSQTSRGVIDGASVKSIETFSLRDDTTSVTSFERRKRRASSPTIASMEFDDLPLTLVSTMTHSDVRSDVTPTSCVNCKQASVATRGGDEECSPRTATDSVGTVWQPIVCDKRRDITLNDDVISDFGARRECSYPREVTSPTQDTPTRSERSVDGQRALCDCTHDCDVDRDASSCVRRSNSSAACHCKHCSCTSPLLWKEKHFHDVMDVQTQHTKFVWKALLFLFVLAFIWMLVALRDLDAVLPGGSCFSALLVVVLSHAGATLASALRAPKLLGKVLES